MQVASLTYRLYQHKDLKGILDLWQKYSGWGGITEQQFYDWHINTPNGPCTIVIAETPEKEIMGQIVFRPTKILIRGQEANGFRAMAPILNTEFRATDIKNYDHPVYAMFRWGIIQAVGKQIDFVFFTPSIGWIAVVKTFPSYGLPKAEISLFDCIGIDIEKINALNSKEEKYWNVRVGKINSAYEDIWKKFVVNLPVNYAVNRSAHWLAWRRSGDLILEVYDSSHRQEIKGVVIIKKESGQVVEIIASTPQDMKQALCSAACWIYQNKTDLNISEIKLMHTPFIGDLVKDLPCYPVNFRFAFVCLGTKNIKVPSIDEWFIMPDE